MPYLAIPLMRIIDIEDTRTLVRNSVLLLLLGLGCVLFGWFSQNPATAALGASFSVLTLAGWGLGVNGQAKWARMAWALLTPLLIFISPVLFPVTQASSIVTYGYFYIGGLVFSQYYLQEKGENLLAWVSSALFLLAFLTFDQLMVRMHFRQTPYEGLYWENFIHLKIAQLIHFVSILFLLNLVRENKVSIQQKLTDRIHKLTLFTGNILSYGRNKVISGGDLVPSLEQVLRKTAEVVDVSRVSVWEYEAETESIRLVVAYDTVSKVFSYDQRLYRKDYPAYFRSLLEEKIISADEAAKDARTAEFCNGYLQSLGIKSMLDSPFFVQGEFKGILCFEEQRSPKAWDEVDAFFSMALSKLISICYYASTIRQQYEDLASLSRDLEARNTELEQINNRISAINGELEGQLQKERESMLELWEFLEKLPFKNAHEIRGPLSRILALVYHYRNDPNPENHDFSLTHIEAAASEIDEIVKEIAHILAQKERKPQQGSASEGA